MSSEHRHDDLMTIGDFARASRLTPKALRLYDELGLLPPAEVDEHSGYRRYAPEQLDRARLVATLRLVGMPLARIRQAVEGPPAATARAVEAYWAQVEADTAGRRDLVATLVQQLRDEEHDMTTPTTTLHATWGSSHRRGARAEQQDALLASAGLFAVADGFGERTDLAGAVLEAYASAGLAAAVAEVAAEITAGLPGAPASGTTLTAVAVDGARATVTHVGDARVWLVRDGSTEQVTHDHTLVAALVESGQLTPDEARSHEHRSLLNRALSPGVVVDTTELELMAGDRLVLTTDGVHAHVDDLATLLCATASPQEVADAVGEAVAAAGEPDNHTVLVVDLG